MEILLSCIHVFYKLQSGVKIRGIFPAATQTSFLQFVYNYFEPTHSDETPDEDTKGAARRFGYLFQENGRVMLDSIIHL